VSLRPEFITEVRWWAIQEFAERDVLGAAELIAFGVFEPVLRSRGQITKAAKQLSERTEFRDRMTAVFTGMPAGNLILLSFQDALRKLDEFERRIATLEKAGDV